MANSPQLQEEIPERYVASELNFARLPFFASSTSNLKTKSGVTYEDTVEHDGRKVNVVWEVTGNTKYGYPGPFAEAVHTAILDIITEQGIPFQNPVVFSFYDICKRLGLKHGGRTTKDIREAIYSIRMAGIIIENSFVTKDGRRISLTPDPTFLYQRILLYGETNQDTGETMQLSAVWLADFYLESLNNGNIRPLDFEHFKYLHNRSYTATKLYRYLGYRFSGTFKHKNDYAKVDYDELTAVADITRKSYLSQAKHKLDRPHQALIDSGFVRHIEWKKEKQVDGSKKFYIYYYPGSRARDEYQNGRSELNNQLDLPLFPGSKKQERRKAPSVSEADTEKTAPIVHQLVELGVTSNRAKELAEEYSEKRIHDQLDHLEHLSEAGESIDNPAGWLVSAIEKNFTTPTGFLDQDERKAKEEAQARAAERRRKKREKEEEEQQQRKARQKKLDQKLAELPEDEQGAIEEEITQRIKSSFDDFMRSFYRTNKKEFDPKSPMHRPDYYNHLEELLDERSG